MYYKEIDDNNILCNRYFKKVENTLLDTTEEFDKVTSEYQQIVELGTNIYNLHEYKLYIFDKTTLTMSEVDCPVKFQTMYEYDSDIYLATARDYATSAIYKYNGSTFTELTGKTREPNILEYGSEYDNSAWYKGTNTTVIADNVLYDNGVYADQITASGGAVNTNIIYQIHSIGSEIGNRTFYYSSNLKSISGDTTLQYNIRSSSDAIGTSNSESFSTSWDKYEIEHTFTTSTETGIRVGIAGYHQSSAFSVAAINAELREVFVETKTGDDTYFFEENGELKYITYEGNKLYVSVINTSTNEVICTGYRFEAEIDKLSLPFTYNSSKLFGMSFSDGHIQIYDTDINYFTTNISDIDGNLIVDSEGNVIGSDILCGIMLDGIYDSTDDKIYSACIKSLFSNDEQLKQYSDEITLVKYIQDGSNSYLVGYNHVDKLVYMFKKEGEGDFVLSGSFKNNSSPLDMELIDNKLYTTSIDNVYRGRVLNFNGVNAYIECFTASKPDYLVVPFNFVYNSTGTNQTIYTSDVNSVSGALQIRIKGASDAIQLLRAGVAGIYESPNALVDGQQYTCAVSFDLTNGDYNVFIKNVEDTSRNYADYALFNWGLNAFGRLNSGEYYESTLYDTAIIHDRPLTDAEIADTPTALDNICANEPEKIYRMYLDGADPTSDTIKPQGTLSSTEATLYNFDLPNDYSQTELLTANSDFDNSYWTKNNITAISDTITSSTSASYARVYHLNVPVKSGKQYEFSFLTKDFVASSQFSLRIVEATDTSYNFTPEKGKRFRVKFTPINSTITVFIYLNPDGDSGISTEGDFIQGDISLQEQGTVRPSQSQKHGFNVANNLLEYSENFSQGWTTFNGASIENKKRIITNGTSNSYIRTTDFIDFGRDISGEEVSFKLKASADYSYTYTPTIYFIYYDNSNVILGSSSKELSLTAELDDYFIKRIAPTGTYKVHVQIAMVGTLTSADYMDIDKAYVVLSAKDNGYYKTEGTPLDNVIIHADLSNDGYDLNGEELQQPNYYNGFRYDTGVSVIEESNVNMCIHSLPAQTTDTSMTDGNLSTETSGEGLYTIDLENLYTNTGDTKLKFNWQMNDVPIKYMIETNTNIYNNEVNSSVQEPELFLYNSDFNNSVWNKGSTVTITTDDAVAPDGTMTADRYTATGSGGGLSRLRQSVLSGIDTSNKTYKLSFWAKSVDGTTETFYVRIGSGSDSGGVETTKVVSGDYWEQVELTVTRPDDGLTGVLGSIGNYNQGAIDVYIWGASIQEVAGYDEDYIDVTSDIDDSGIKSISLYLPTDNKGIRQAELILDKSSILSFSQYGMTGEIEPSKYWTSDDIPEDDIDLINIPEMSRGVKSSSIPFYVQNTSSDTVISNIIVKLNETLTSGGSDEYLFSNELQISNDNQIWGKEINITSLQPNTKQLLYIRGNLDTISNFDDLFFGRLHVEGEI